MGQNVDQQRSIEKCLNQNSLMIVRHAGLLTGYHALEAEHSYVSWPWNFAKMWGKQPIPMLVIINLKYQILIFTIERDVLGN